MSSGVLAEWEELGSGNGGAFTFYADRTTIRKAGTKVKMWDLMDYREIQKSNGIEAHLSTKNQAEYDCNAEKSRLLYLSNHAGKMGSGGVTVISERSDNWTPIPPRSVDEALWKVACGVQ